MKITIVTAAIRPEGLLKVFKSLDEQTYQDFEHIIVNDNREGIRDVLKYTYDRDNRRYWIDIRFKTGYYGAFARNIGAMTAFTYFSERSRKEDRDYWIMFLDDDNLFHPTFLERVVECHKNNPQATFIGADIEIRGYKNTSYKKLLKNELFSQHTDLGAFAYKRSLFNKYGYFQADLEHKNSFDWMLIKKITDNEPKESVIIMEGEPGLIFYSKKH